MTDAMEGFDRVNDIFDRLSEDARMRHVPYALRNITKAEQLEEARAFLSEVLESGAISANALGKRTNVKPTAISAFRNNCWKGAKGAEVTTAGMLMRGLDQFFQAQEAEETSIAGHADTRFYERFYETTMYAVKRNLIAAIVAQAGHGKSMALRAIHEEIAGSYLVTIRRCRSSTKAFLQLWARSLGLQEFGRAEDIQERIMNALSSTGRVGLFDEVHKLSIAGLDVLREVWDDVKTPMILAGTPSFYQTLTTHRTGVAAAELMDQLYSRVGVYRNLAALENPQTGEPEPVVSPSDIRKVFQRAHIRLAKSGVDFLSKLANHPGAGGYRVCADLVQMVIDLYPNEEVTAERLNAAMVMRAGPSEAGFTLAKAGVVPAGERQAVAAAG